MPAESPTRSSARWVGLWVSHSDGLLRGLWLVKMSLHERDRDRFQSSRYVKRWVDVDLEDDAAMLGGEIDATER